MKVLQTVVGAIALIAIASNTMAITYVESAGIVVGEGEIFSNRIDDGNGDGWVVKPGENNGSSINDGGPIITNARGGAYVQGLPDNLTNGGPNIPPEIHYQIKISTPGTYRLYARWDGNNTNGTTRGQSDSLFADIIELKDGVGGTVADWYEFTQGVNGNFANPAWDGGAGFEQNVAGAANNPAVWNITTEGIYTLRFTQREDGSALDAWVLQLSNLTAPTGTGPAISQVIPEPTTATLGLVSVGGLLFGRRRRN